MIKKIGAVFFFFMIIVAAIGFANSLAITYYEKSLIAVIRDFVFILTRK